MPHRAVKGADVPLAVQVHQEGQPVHPSAPVAKGVAAALTQPGRLLCSCEAANPAGLPVDLEMIPWEAAVAVTQYHLLSCSCGAANLANLAKLANLEGLLAEPGEEAARVAGVAVKEQGLLHCLCEAAN